MFYGFPNLVEINGFQSLDLSSAKNLEKFFGNCNKLKLDLSYFDTSKVTNISEMFSGYSSNQTLDISGFDISKVKESSGIFDREKEYYESKILVKNEAMKTWVLEQNPELINVLMK